METLPPNLAPVTSAPLATPVAPVAPSSSRKMILVGVAVFVVLGVGIYSQLGGGSGVKGSFTEGTAPITAEAAPAPITQEAAPVATIPSSPEGVVPAPDAAPAPVVKSLPVAVKTISSSDASVKPGESTTITIKGGNLSPMILASSGTALTFTNTTIVLTISSGADISFSDLSVSSDGSMATVKATVGDMAVSGSYPMNYFDIAVSDKPLGTMQNVLTVAY